MVSKIMQQIVASRNDCVVKLVKFFIVIDRSLIV